MSKMKYVHNDVDWMIGIERGLSEYLDNLWEAFDNDDYYDNEESAQVMDNVSLTGVYFCGCDDCVKRETIAYLLPRLVDGFKAGKLEDNEEYTGDTA